MSEAIIIGLVIAVGGVAYYAWRLREVSFQQQRAIADLKRKMTQEEQVAVREQIQQSTLSDVAYDALIVIDTDYHIIMANRAAKNLFRDSDLVGKEMVQATQTPELEITVQAALSHEEGMDGFEEQLTIHEGSYRVRAQVFNNDGQILIGVALQDITQLVKLNRARRDMVANISHELRTPIANIRLIIDGLFHDRDKPKRKESITSLKAIAAESDALLWLVQSMADLSMIESGQAIVRLLEVPLAELVEEAILRIVDQSDAKGLQIVRQVPENIAVLCDRGLTKRVLVNLIHNAMKWSPEGEAITLEAVNGADEVTIGVLDKGPGVPDDQVERIFERFYQVDSSRSRHEGGTGLGLAICKHIVEAQGGRIWAEGNSDSSGGRFRFTLLSAENHISTDDVSQ